MKKFWKALLIIAIFLNLLYLLEKCGGEDPYGDEPIFLTIGGTK